MARTGITYVMLGSQRPDVGDAIRPFCRLTRLGEEEARHLLSSHGPRLFRAYARHGEAEGLAAQIHALGLYAATLTPEDIWEYVFVEVSRLNLGQGGISGFGDPGEAPLYVPFSDIVAIVQGDVSDIAGKGRVLTPDPESSKTPEPDPRERLVDIHCRSVPVAMRIRKSEFRMNPHVAGEPVGEATDLDRFLRLIVARTPGAVVDTGFERASEAVDVSLQMLDGGGQVVTPSRSARDDAPPTPPRLPAAPVRTDTELVSLSSFELYSTLWRWQGISG